MVFNFKNCLYSSLGLHVAIFLFFAVITGNSGIKKPFIVFGAHSKKDYHTMYRRGQINHRYGGGVPFVHGNSGTGKKRGGGRRNKKVNVAKARALNKKLAKSKAVQNLIKTKKMEAALKKRAVGSDRPLIHEIKDKKIKLTKSQVKKQIELEKFAEAELAKKLELEAMVSAKKHELELKKLNEEAQKKLEKEKELALEKVEKKIEEEVKKVAEEVKSEVEPMSPTDGDASAADDCVDEAFDINETTSMLVLSLHGNVDPEMEMYQKFIQQEVERLWKPPLGVPRGTTCRIGFIVDKSGSVKNFEISKRSNVLIYDLSILRVAHLFKFNKKLWGKSFTIDFCQ